MYKPHAGYRIGLTLLTVAFVFGLAASASADTIYLKNGRVIRTSSARIEGDRVIFIQYAGEVSIPLALVDRIVEDTSVEPVGAPPAVAVADPEAGGPEAAPESEDVAPEQTREYWQDRVRAIAAEREEIALRLEDLRRTERAFLFSHRSTADTRGLIVAEESRLTDLDEEMRGLQAEARSLQIPAGWLRLTPQGGQGGQGAPPGQGGVSAS